MKRILMVFVVVLLTSLTSFAQSYDYSKLSNQELANLRGTLYNNPTAQSALRAEMQKRVVTMSAQERSQLAIGQGRGLRVNQNVNRVCTGTGSKGLARGRRR